MKKLFISIIALVSAMTMTAQTTADVTLRLESQSGSVSELYLFAGPDLAANPERGSLMVNASNPEDVNIFAVDPANNNRYGSFGNETLVNIPVGIITSKEAEAKQSYTIHFEVYESTYVLKLKDLLTGTETTITDGGSYAFTITAATDPSFVEGSYSVIADRFVINYDATAFVTSLTTNEDGWASFAYSANVAPALPAGLKIYKGALDLSDVENPAISLTEVNAIPAEAGVFVKGAPLTEYHFVAASASALTGNDIVGCVAATSVSNFGSDAIYTLRHTGSGTALWQYVGTDDIPAGKAVLPINLGGSPAPQRIRMIINEAQAVENVAVESVKAEKFVENGQIFIRRGNEVYNLQGQMVK